MVEEVYTLLKDVQREDSERLKKLLLMAGAFGTVWAVTEYLLSSSDSLLALFLC
jgi:hypothetical protein